MNNKIGRSLDGLGELAHKVHCGLEDVKEVVGDSLSQIDAIRSGLFKAKEIIDGILENAGK